MELKNINNINENDFLNYINEWNKERIYPLNSDPKNLGFFEYKEKINKSQKSELFFLVSPNGYILGAIDIKYKLDKKHPYSSSHLDFGIRPLERNKNFAFIMIKLALNKLRINGVTKAVIIINRENKASRNTITKVSGKLVCSKVIKGEVLERYEIEL